MKNGKLEIEKILKNRTVEDCFLGEKEKWKLGEMRNWEIKNEALENGTWNI